MNEPDTPAAPAFDPAHGGGIPGDPAAAIDAAHAARRQAEAANRAKDGLLATLCHEMRNPLNALVTASEVLNRAAPNSPEAGSARQIIGRQTRRLGQLLDELGELGRALAEDSALLRQPLELGALTRRCVAHGAAAAEAKGQALRLEIEEVWVDADAQRLAQAIERLLEHVVRTQPASGRILVRVAAVSGAQQLEAVIDVRDDAVGAARAAPCAHKPPREDRPGIGLSLVRNLIEKQGGRLEADGGGAFALRLPMIAPPGRGPAPAAGASNRIGVIEDNPDALFGVCALLELGGHRVTTAADGPAGLAMLLREAPDVALVDIGLPGFDGYEVARLSRAGGFRGRLIALSGLGPAPGAGRSLAAGFEAHLVKPVDSERLSRLLDA